MATIEIDGKTLEVENGQMIIEAADNAGIYIPRFCYHKKLSIAANCRMCLVEVENNRKTVPACATPINNGMKIFTKSAAAKRSQEAVMDFLLINHPLDCPICDQGGECELQDVAMAYGSNASSYEETKRSVADEGLGTLIATEMTRCIHCTRCVRFGDEIAGVRELGGIGRGEHMQISTYVDHSMQSEVSANIIDLCPVGALTAKPSRFTARAWELTQTDSIATHDCLGSNIHLHTRRGELMRVVPKENESINETWLSDRDRFSYLGLKSPLRAVSPMIKRDGQWHTVEWQEALEFAAAGMSRVIKQHGAAQWGAFASPSSSVEEFYLLQKLMRDLGVANIDYRLRQTDVRDQNAQSILPNNTISYEKLSEQKSIVILGSHLHREVPLAAVRVRKAFTNGASVVVLNAMDYTFPFDVAQKVIISPNHWVATLAKVLRALVTDDVVLPGPVQQLLANVTVDIAACDLARALQQPQAVIVAGLLIDQHPEAAILRTLIALLSKYSGAAVIKFTEGANSAGGSIAGMLPHRGVAGTQATTGLAATAAIDAKLKGYLLLGVEPGFDFASPNSARQAMLAAEFVVVLSAFQGEEIQEYADVILPMAAFTETSGTYINLDGVWQTVAGVMAPPAEARPAWKILRVLANVMQREGFKYASTTDVLAEVQEQLRHMAEIEPAYYFPETLPTLTNELSRLGEWPLYRIDSIVRRSNALQKCAAAEKAVIRLHPDTVQRFGLNDTATVSQGDIEITLPLLSDARVAPNVVYVANALPETIDLGHAFASIVIK